MLGLYHPMSSPQMTRMLGFFSSPKAGPRAIIKSVRVINFAFINTARRDWLKSLPLTIKKSRPATMRLWSYSGTRLTSSTTKYKSTRTTVATLYALVLNEKNLVALSSFQCLDSTLPDSFQQRLIIALVLIGVGERKPGDGFIEARV